MNMLDELSDTALVVKSLGNSFVRISQIGENYFDSSIKKSLLTEPFQKHFIVVDCGFLKYCRVGFEHNGSTRLRRFANYLHRLVILTAVMETLIVNVFAVLNGKFQPFGKSVYNGRTNAVKTSRNLVASSSEFSARVENRINDRSRRNTLFRVDTSRYTSAVVGNADNVSF